MSELWECPECHRRNEQEQWLCWNCRLGSRDERVTDELDRLSDIPTPTGVVHNGPMQLLHKKVKG